MARKREHIGFVFLLLGVSFLHDAWFDFHFLGYYFGVVSTSFLSVASGSLLMSPSGVNSGLLVPKSRPPVFKIDENGDSCGFFPGYPR